MIFQLMTQSHIRMWSWTQPAQQVAIKCGVIGGKTTVP
jgi:hypothetical protein